MGRGGCEVEHNWRKRASSNRNAEGNGARCSVRRG
jgi:hypothetical protein